MMRRLAWFTLAWNIVTILIGAVVRATGSGAGCGRSWPSCQGEIVPELSGATAVEFTHRAASGIALVLVGVLVFRVLRSHQAPHPARTGGWVAAIAIVGEALIGAAIVLAEWVADDDSLARTVAVPLHLVNTLLLLAALTVVVFTVDRPDRAGVRVLRGLPPAYWAIAGGMVAIAATGAVTGLADTLFPKSGVSFETGEHVLTTLRIVHPVVAIAVGLAAIGWLRGRTALGRIIGGLVLAQLALGGLNVVLGTPLWLSVVHLLVADVLWIAWVAWGLSADARSRPDRPLVDVRAE